MNQHDEEILRLNKKIKHLIWQNEQSDFKYSVFVKTYDKFLQKLTKNEKKSKAQIITLITIFSSDVARESFGDRKQAFVASGKRVEGNVHADVVAQRQIQDATAARD